MNIEDKILKYALQNAVKFNGQANQGAIIGKLIADDPKIKPKLKELSKKINETVKKVNSLSLEEQTNQLNNLAPELLKEKKPKKEKKTRLHPLEKAVKGKVIMRFAPSPSGPMHIGHAMTLGVISEYCKMYDGKLIFRIEDTNPENIYIPAYEMLQKEADWLTKKGISEFVIQSDRLKIYYKYIEKLIDKDAVYICTCHPDKYKELISHKKECPCRSLPKKEQKQRWEKMLKTYKQGEAVARVKTDIKHKNPAMRDFPIARINETEHPLQGKKYRVWPLMNLSVFVDDVEFGMTHIIRGKDHADNAKRQEFMYNYLKKPIPITEFQGRINFTDMQLACSKTKKAIEEKKYSGWDDIRLPFLDALKRRGYQPGAFLKWAVSMSSLADKTVSKDELFKMINAFNKEIIDPISYRYFFIEEPVKIKIENTPKFEAELDLHPDNKKKGRKFKIDGNFYVAKEDFKELKNNKLVRLMDCLNFTPNQNKFIFDSKEYEKYKEKGDKIIHWLPVSKELVNVEVLMPDNTIKKGLAEPLVKNLKQGTIIQFERFGFCRLDSLLNSKNSKGFEKSKTFQNKEKNKLVFWFAHR